MDIDGIAALYAAIHEQATKDISARWTGRGKARRRDICECGDDLGRCALDYLRRVQAVQARHHAHRVTAEEAVRRLAAA